MSVKLEEEIRREAVLRVAELMLIAARTAPKARGLDNIYASVVEGDTLKIIAEKMKEISIREELSFFNRDANNVLVSQAMVMLGTKFAPINLKKCGYCGYKNCEDNLKSGKGLCFFNANDLGIAIGSAVSVASLHKVDCRVFFSAGYAAIEAKILPEYVRAAFGIPLSVSAKSPFFDRT